MRVLKVGLTGGIGSGKSVVAARLAALGALIVDSDRLARDVVAPGTDGLREVVAAFGERVLREDGSLNREALGEVVFGDAAARTRLEGIIHPRVRAESARRTAEAAPDAIVVNDVPLLVEVGLAPTYHLVIVVSAASAVRIERLVRDRGMTEEQARQRIRAQVDDERRRAAADALLVNDGGLDELYAAVEALWHDRLVPYERNVREERVAVPAADPGPPAREPVEPRPDAASGPAEGAAFDRLAARIRYALRPAEARVDHLGTAAAPGRPGQRAPHVRVTVDPATDAGDLAERLARAGLPPEPAGHRGGELRHGSADPGQPVRLRVTGFAQRV